MSRGRRRDRTEVSCCIKYLVFGFNVLFWLIGGGLLAIGIWAWTEKDMFTNISNLSSMTLDPALAFIIVGLIMFVVGFFGCVGALRENTCLLAIFAVALGIMFLMEVTIAVLLFVFKDPVRNEIEKQVETMIIKYRDDPDLQNLIDWVQTDWLQCCGVKDYNDWDKNIYFNCSSKTLGSREACGVPFSCCKQVKDESILNHQCGYDVRSEGYVGDRSAIINTEGCIKRGQDWIEKHLIPVAGTAVAVAFMQILGICFAHNLRSDILAQKAKWR